MAAYAALVSLARLIDQILSQDQDYAFLCDKEQMESLREKVIRLQEFLEHVSVRFRSSTTLDVFESRIRDVAYQLDYIIESVICRLIDQEFQSDQEFESDRSRCTELSQKYTSVAKAFSRRLGSIVSCTGGSKGEAGSHPFASLAPLSAVFTSCIVETDIILEEATEMKNIPVEKSSAANSSRGAPIAKVINVGLDNEIAKIVGTITGRESKLQIIPITGMGGIGKTTLARAVFDDSRLLHHFDVRFWVTISQEFDVRAILRELLPSKQQTEHPDDRLIEHVHKNLHRRRFLIVLDDMWDGKAWDGVRNAFPDDNKGSRIIITTRELGVASYVGSFIVHNMQLLNEDQSWSMLREKVYGQEPCLTELEGIGRTISNNCKGLPLTIVVIAGLLKLNKMKKYWEEVAENTKAAAAIDNDHLFGILSLSYNNLSPQLKACFLYMGSFPEDYEFRTKELVMLWTAEGFLKPRESKTMAEIAEDCLEELVERSLVLPDSLTKTTFSIHIHDVLREVSIRKAKEENFLRHYSTSPVEKITEHLHNKNDLIKFQTGTYDVYVRSLRYEILTGGSRFRRKHRLGALCNLTSLRYLHVNNKAFDIIFPKSISKLQNLETLIIERWTDRSVLPLDIWKLSRLTHLILYSYWSPQLPPLDGQGVILENLQTLCGLSNINLSMDVVERIPNVKNLRVVYENVSSDFWQEFSVSNLRYLHQLEVLFIMCWPLYIGLPTSTRLVFPQSLKELSLFGTKIQLEKLMSVIGLLPNLEVLKLDGKSIVGKVWEPIEGEFLKLKYLKMEFLDIEEWLAESDHFPCLEKLQIKNCKYLKEVRESIGEIGTLQELFLGKCPIAKESVLKIQEIQQSFGNEFLKITIEDNYW